MMKTRQRCQHDTCNNASAAWATTLAQQCLADPVSIVVIVIIVGLCLSSSPRLLEFWGGLVGKSALTGFILRPALQQITLYPCWRESSYSPGTLIVDQPTTNQLTTKQPTTDDQLPTTNDQWPMTNDQQPTAEELKYSRNRARRGQCPTNNMLEVWQNLASFSGRPISGVVVTLLTKVVNRQLSVSLIVLFLL